MCFSNEISKTDTWMGNCIKAGEYSSRVIALAQERESRHRLGGFKS
jgi:hypothetical protein